MTNSGNAFAYLVGTVLDLLITAVMLRVLLQAVRADWYNPISQFLVKVTDPVLQPLRRIVPPVRRVDTAAILLMLLLEFASVWIVSRLGSNPLAPSGVLLFSITKLMATLLTLYFVLIIVAVLLSWLAPGSRHPVVPLVHQLTRPVLRPIRRLIPPIAGVDLSPLIALIAIRFLMLLLGM